MAESILVVEDDAATLSIVSFILEEAGYRVLQANCGRQALSLVEKVRPHLIVSDVVMPDLSGFELCQRLRSDAAMSQIPFIFLTAQADRSHMRQGMALGADDYLVKPFEPEELLSAVSVRLARAAETQAIVAQATDDLKGVVVQTLTHELRTPLALMLGYTELLETIGLGMGEVDLQMILQGLYTGTRRLMGMAEDLLMLTRLESGLFAAHMDELPGRTDEPDHMVGSTVGGLQGQARARGVALSLRLGTPAASVAIDPLFLQEIVRRLTDNAIKFSKEQGGRVLVSTRSEGAGWVLEVADTGCGIRQEALGWIFQAFRQADRAKIEQQGVGLGLAIVRGLVEVYEGRVSVESVEGKGSRFSVWLPVAPPESRARQPGQEVWSQSQGQGIIPPSSARSQKAPW